MGEFEQSERQGVTIVAVGSFNPAIFHPAWFAQHKLIREAEAEESKVEVVSTEITVVKSEWFNIQATNQRFSLETRDPTKFQPLRDLVVATFDILEHTPISSFGFNSLNCFELDSVDAWHRVGHHFAPKQSWDAILDEPGMRKVTMEGKRGSCSADRIQISIQPAASSVSNGVVIIINEHYEIDASEDTGSTNSARAFIERLQQGWDGFLEFSRTTAEHLLREGSAPS
jgi:hypothetical protein